MLSSAVKRRIGYSLAYEGIAIVCSSIILLLAGNSLRLAFPFAAFSSAFALLWNFIWNTLFEQVEKSLDWKGRPTWVRMLHAVGFEGGLGLMLIPIMAWWLAIPLIEAFFTELGLLAFFLLYTYVFSFSFDKIFGLPESAR